MFASLQTRTDLAALFLRFGLAAIFVVHGYIKIDQDYPILEHFSLTMQRVVGWAELLCGVCLAAGLLTRLAALGVIVMQTAAIGMVTGVAALTGPPMKRTGADFMQVGPEYNLVLITMCVSLIWLGGGTYSLDHVLADRLRRRRAAAPAPQPAAV